MKFSLGIDVGASKIAGAIVSSDGVLRDRREIATDAQKVTDQIIGFVKQFNLIDVNTIGIGFPGVVERGVVISSTNIPNFDQVPLAEIVSKLTEKKLVAANDADMALAGEMWLGVAKDKKKVIMLTLGSGIGGAIAQKPNSELGHTVVDPGSVLTCNQGHRGDIESLIGGLVTEKRLGRKMADLIRDPVFQKTYLEHLSRAIEQLVSLYSPELIVLGGGIIQSAQYFFNQLPKFSVPVELAKLGKDAGIYGAAHKAMAGGLGDWLA